MNTGGEAKRKQQQEDTSCTQLPQVDNNPKLSSPTSLSCMAQQICADAYFWARKADTSQAQR